MAGPLVFWPNRKSRMGARRLSRVPRRLFRPPWFTTPPIAKEDDMRNKLDLTVLPSTLAATNTAGQFAEHLTAVHELVKTHAPHLLASYAALLTDFEASADREDALLRLRKENIETKRQLVEALRAHLPFEEQLKALREQLGEAMAEQRRIRKEHDADAIELRTLYRIDEAMAEHRKELAAAKETIATKDSEIAELRRSKKRLREALDRLARNT